LQVFRARFAVAVTLSGKADAVESNSGDVLGCYLTYELETVFAMGNSARAYPIPKKQLGVSSSGSFPFADGYGVRILLRRHVVGETVHDIPSSG